MIIPQFLCASKCEVGGVFAKANLALFTNPPPTF